MAPPRRTAARLAALLISTGLAVAGAEAYLRHFAPVKHRQPEHRRPNNLWHELLHRASEVEGLRYEMAPNRNKERWGKPIRTNSLGMRDREPLPLTEDLLRVVTVGDSFTFGLRVAVEEAYPDVLESLLCAGAARPCDVLNLGVSGYSVSDYARVVEHRALAHQPDLIIVGYVLDDPQNEPYLSLHRYYAPTEWWQSFHLLRLLHQTRFESHLRQYGGDDYVRYLHTQPEKWASVERAFANMRAAAGEIPVLVVIFPMGPNHWSDYAYPDLHGQVSEAARAAGLDVMDLLPVFESEAPLAVRIAPRDAHPSVLGHRKTAEAIMKEIRARYPALALTGPESAPSARSP